jgi:hypothetical protein
METTVQVHRVSNYFKIAYTEYVWYFFVKAEHIEAFTAEEIRKKMETFYTVFGTYEDVCLFGKNKLEPVVKSIKTVVETMPYTAIPHNTDFLILNVNHWHTFMAKTSYEAHYYDKLKASRQDDAFLMATKRNILPSDWMVANMEELNTRWEKERPFIERLADIWVKHCKFKTSNF